MKKNKFLIMVMFLIMMLVSNVCFASSYNAILQKEVSGEGLKGYYPVLDGLMNEKIQKQINVEIKKHVDNLVKAVGNKGNVSFTLKINKPTIFSVLLKANNNGQKAYDAINMDLATGKECVAKDYFYLNESYYKLLGEKSEFLLAEKGIYFRKDKNDLNGDFSNFVKYTDFASSLNIVNVARYLPVVKITKQVKNNTLVVSEGDFIAIKLETERSAGLNWNFDSSDRSNVFEVGRSYLMSRMEKTDAIIKPDYDIVFIETKKAGKYKVLFTYKHAWEKFVEPSIIFDVVVEENK